MGRAGQQVLWDAGGLQDRISVGLLARPFPRATVDAVVEAAGAREQRTQMLPSWLVVYYVQSLARWVRRVLRAVSGGAGGCSAWMAPPWMCRAPRRTGPASVGRVPAMSPAPGCKAGFPRSGWWLWPSAAPGR